MKKNKILCTIVALLLIVTVFVPATAQAASPDYFFTFDYDDTGEHYESYHAKGDTEQKWVVTLYDTAGSNMSTTNVLSLKMNRAGVNNVDRWHTFSNYVQRYGIPYQTVVSETDSMRLGMKKINSSSPTANLYITGAYNP